MCRCKVVIKDDRIAKGGSLPKPEQPESIHSEKAVLRKMGKRKRKTVDIDSERPSQKKGEKDFPLASFHTVFAIEFF